MSAFSIGARMGRRRPGPKRMLSSTVAASAMPCSTIEMASRHSACCRRLATKPGTSFLQSMGCLPTRRRRSMVRSTTAGSTCSVRTTSTSGIRYGGFQKCVPTTRSLCAALSPIWVMLMTEVLVHRMVSGGQAASSRSNTLCLRARSSNTHSTTTSAPCRGADHVAGGADPADGVLDAVGREQTMLRQEGEVRRERAGRALQGLVVHVLERDLVSGGGEDLGHAHAHHAAADDGDALERCAFVAPLESPAPMALRAVWCSRTLLPAAADQPAELPPSTIRMSPVTKSDAAEAR